METSTEKNRDKGKFYGELDLFDLMPLAKQIIEMIDKDICNVDITDIMVLKKQ